MPYKSDAQRKYFNANRKELESQGVDVDEWNQSSKGKKLPEKVKDKEKVARNLDLGNVPSGSGPQQMYNALSMLNQARALVDTPATLKRHRVPQRSFENTIDELATMDGDKYDFDALRQSPRSSAVIKGLIGALAGGAAGSLHSPAGLVGGAALGGLGGAGAGYLGASGHNKRLAQTAKVLRDYGLLRPDYLRAALPLLKQGNERGFLQSMLDEVRRKVEGARVAELARKYAPGALGGAAAGAGMGLLSDPGHDEEGKRRSRFSSLPANALGGAALGIGAQHFAPQISEYIGSGGRERGVDLYNRSKAVNSFNKLAESSGDRDYGDEKNQKSEAKKDKKHQARTKLGPLEHAYVADAMGGQALQNTSRKLKEMHKDPDNPYKSLYDRLVTSQAGLNEGLGERISRGSARMAESPVWRALSMLDPTVTGKNEGLVGAMSGFGGGEDKAQGAKRRAAEAYAKFLKKHQDKVDPEAKTTERETPFHINAQGMLANLDSDIAGHKYMRNERPLHYWLNPMNKSGPLSELTDRGVRRIVAGNASPESNAGRLGMTVGGLATLGLLPMITGGEQAQQKLRASAVKNRLYAPEAMPEEKAASVIELLARTMAKQARCWKGYEPVPGKKPYSEDSCRPAGSGKKKKEKKAASCGGSGSCDACGTEPCECNSDSDIKQLAKVSALHTLPR